MNIKRLISSLLAGLLTTVVGVVLGYYLSNEYKNPKIEYYSRPYYKIDDVAIGNIYLLNSGRKKDSNIAITIYEDIKEENIKIVDVTSKYKVDHNDNKTIITIDELKPNEGADITFKTDNEYDDFDINMVSDYSIFEARVLGGIEKKWWHWSIWSEIAILVITLFTGIVLGHLKWFYKNKNT